MAIVHFWGQAMLHTSETCRAVRLHKHIDIRVWGSEAAILMLPRLPWLFLYRARATPSRTDHTIRLEATYRNDVSRCGRPASEVMTRQRAKAIFLGYVAGF
jgi:hypothetical protein